jgi:GntR family transcriptional regulator
MGNDLGDRVTALDRGSPVPLWAQVVDDLRHRLRSGEFIERFPTDRELVAQYGASRHTVREAVRCLRTEGLVVRERGRGSQAVAPEFEQLVGSFYSLFRSIECHGVEQVSSVRALELRTDPEVAWRLGLEGHEQLVFLERLRRAGGQPLALDRTWLPADLASPLMGADFRHTGLYDELAARCGLEAGWARERIRPVVPDPSERQVLEVGPGEAGFAIERLTRATSGRLMEWRQGLVRGDRYAFVAEWQTQGRRPLAPVIQMPPRPA